MAKLNGVPVQDDEPATFSRRLAALKPGETIELSVRPCTDDSPEKEHVVTIIVGSRPAPVTQPEHAGPAGSTNAGLTGPIPDESFKAFLRTATTQEHDESDEGPVPIRNLSTEPWLLDKSQGWHRSLIDERQGFPIGEANERSDA